MARTTSCLTVSVSGCSNLNDPIEIPIESGPHTLQVRSGRNSSRTLTFDAAEARSSPSAAAARGFCRSFWRPSSFPACTLAQARVGATSRIREHPDKIIGPVDDPDS